MSAARLRNPLFDVETLQQVIAGRSQTPLNVASSIHIFNEGKGTYTKIPQPTFCAAALSFADVLRTNGVRPGTIVIIVSTTNWGAFLGFLAASACGGVPAVHADKNVLRSDEILASRLREWQRQFGTDTLFLLEEAGGIKCARTPSLLNAAGPSRAFTPSSSTPRL